LKKAKIHKMMVMLGCLV